jgi:hypothetical protein
VTTATIETVKQFHPTKWMELAMKGEKITAIEELRATSKYKDPFDESSYTMHIRIAKNIVEQFMASYTTTTNNR